MHRHSHTHSFSKMQSLGYMQTKYANTILVALYKNFIFLLPLTKSKDKRWDIAFVNIKVRACKIRNQGIYDNDQIREQLSNKLDRENVGW